MEWVRALVMAMEHRRFSDIDEQAHCLHGYDQRYVQVGRGCFKGEFITHRLPDGGGALFIERVNLGLVQQGGVPRDTRSVGLLMHPGQGSTVNGVALDMQHIVVLAPGAEFDARLQEGSRFCVIEAPAGPWAGPFRRGDCRVVRIGEQPLDRVRDWVRLALRQGSGPGCVLVPAAGPLIDELLRLASAGDREPPPPRINAVDRHRLYRRTCRWLEARRDWAVGVPELCNGVGASRRSLEYCFRSVVGESPAAFLRVRGLNGLRRDLLAAPAGAAPIASAAAKWGFWHLGRLADDYRQLFGELPSQTLGRAVVTRPWSPARQC